MEVPSSFNVKSEVSTETASIFSKGLQKGLQEVKMVLKKFKGDSKEFHMVSREFKKFHMVS